MANNSFSFYWHDYETFSADPMRGRASQFAGIRTDENFNIIGQPLVIYNKIADDLIPDPEACLITGITPQKTLDEGISENDFIGAIHAEFSQPMTCGVGYNNLRFDDEVTRHTLYRNLYEPYGREWQHGNSRWDIIDMVRLTHALRPEGINWPKHENGETSFRLEDLTKANHIEHESAHDALSDVYATIAIAKLIQQKQPKLYQFIFKNRQKQTIFSLLNIRQFKPVIHISSMYPVSQGCCALIVPLCGHPTNKNGIIAYDLRFDPNQFLSLSVDDIRERLFTTRQQLEEKGLERIPLKTVHANKCPIIVPAGTLNPDSAIQYNISIEQSLQYIEILKKQVAFIENVRQAFDQQIDDGRVIDADYALYHGGFFSDKDKNLMQKIHELAPQNLAKKSFQFDHPYLHELFFRYRARNFPMTLTSQEQSQWQSFCQQKLSSTSKDGCMTYLLFDEKIKMIKESQNLSEIETNLLVKLTEFVEQRRTG
ncbi:MAG: exodeoxyribonuclease I [Methylococcales bacterium]|nr:exodeoxyribonuclease I [Methylococcales bacterium]